MVAKIALFEPKLTIGLEEELFLVDRETRDIVAQIPESLLAKWESLYDQQVVTEFLRCQVEIITKPCHTIAELQEQHRMLRKSLVREAAEYGLAPLAVSTHPSASWREQQPNSQPRYQRIANELQISSRRLLINGMHIHVGITDPEMRLYILNQLQAYLPVFLALSTSSPFWMGEDTGLASFRSSVLDGLPRSGSPKYFATYDEYELYLVTLQKAGVIEDAREIWWDARMSLRYPTVENRISDVCTVAEDAMAVAALYQCLLHNLIRIPSDHGEDHLKRLLGIENRWRSQRYPLQEVSLMKLETAASKPLRLIMHDLLEQLAPDAQALECEQALQHVEVIFERGTSADRQRQVFAQAQARGLDQSQALIQVIDDLIATTQSV